MEFFTGNHIRDLRQELCLTQEELATKLNVARATLAMYEKNLRRPDIDTLAKIARFFDTSADYLLGLSKIRSLYSMPKNKSLLEIFDSLDDQGKDKLLAFARSLQNQ